MLIKDLDIRDVSIIDSLPNYDYSKCILNVGCGAGRIDWHLIGIGYVVYSTDVVRDKDFPPELKFYISDIFDLSSFHIKGCDVVICSQVLEHLKDYKTALKNLLKLTKTRLIITIPFEKSFGSPDHCNHWGEKNVKEFEELCGPYSVSISKIRTKPEDVRLKQWSYLIIVDKRQRYGSWV